MFGSAQAMLFWLWSSSHAMHILQFWPHSL